MTQGLFLLEENPAVSLDMRSGAISPIDITYYSPPKIVSKMSI